LNIHFYAILLNKTRKTEGIKMPIRAKWIFNHGCVILDNDIHPDRPDNSNWECPVCDIFD